MMHQQPPSQQYNMPQGGGQHYQGQQPPMGMMGQVNQGNHMMGQRQIPPYRPPQQGKLHLGNFLLNINNSNWKVLNFNELFVWRQSQAFSFLIYVFSYQKEVVRVGTKGHEMDRKFSSIWVSFIYHFLGKGYIIKFYIESHQLIAENTFFTKYMARYKVIIKKNYFKVL